MWYKIVILTTTKKRRISERSALWKIICNIQNKNEKKKAKGRQEKIHITI